MKIFVAGGTGTVGRPLIARLLAEGHALVALTRSPEGAQDLAERGVESAIADVFDADAIKAVIRRARPEAVIEQLTDGPLAFVCGPTSFVESVAAGLVAIGYAPGRIKTERFGATGGL